MTVRLFFLVDQKTQRSSCDWRRVAIRHRALPEIEDVCLVVARGGIQATIWTAPARFHSPDLVIAMLPLSLQIFYRRWELLQALRSPFGHA